LYVNILGKLCYGSLGRVARKIPLTTEQKLTEPHVKNVGVRKDKMADKKGGHDDHKKDDSHEKSGGNKEAEVLSKFEKYFGVGPTRLIVSRASQVYLRKVAQWLGKLLRRSLPDNHPLRSDLAEFVAYVGVAAIEARDSTILKTIGEFLAAFTQTFCGDEGEDDTKTGRKESFKDLSPELQATLTKATAEMQAFSTEAILKAPPELAEEAEKALLKKADTHWKVQNRLINGPPEEKDKEPGVPFSERLHQVSEAVDKALKPLNEDLEKEIAASRARTAKKQAEQAAERRAKPMTLQRKLRKFLLGI